jgi:hypothetical protein
MTDTALWIVVIAALFTAVMTGVGALPFLFVRRSGRRRCGRFSPACRSR